MRPLSINSPTTPIQRASSLVSPFSVVNVVRPACTRVPLSAEIFITVPSSRTAASSRMCASVDSRTGIGRAGASSLSEAAPSRAGKTRITVCARCRAKSALTRGRCTRGTALFPGSATCTTSKLHSSPDQRCPDEPAVKKNTASRVALPLGALRSLRRSRWPQRPSGCPIASKRSPPEDRNPSMACGRSPIAGDECVSQATACSTTPRSDACTAFHSSITALTRCRSWACAHRHQHLACSAR